ncbi:MAG: ThiF family adenylyltransferase [Candidatus Aenigmatarchaeota archaeon]
MIIKKKPLRKYNDILQIGAGGIGFWLAYRLLLDFNTDFNKLIVVDFDKVEWHNLNRLPYIPKEIEEGGDVGRLKIEAMERFFNFWFKDIVDVKNKLITINAYIDKEKLKDILDEYENIDIVINCSDMKGNITPISIDRKVEYCRIGCDGKNWFWFRIPINENAPYEPEPEKENIYVMSDVIGNYFASIKAVELLFYSKVSIDGGVVPRNIIFKKEL